MNTGKLLSLKKKLSPRGHDPPHAMVDSKGNTVTSAAGIEKISTDHYKKVLGNRNIKDDLKQLQIDKEELSALRADLAKANKSPAWTMEDLDKVLKNLKINKSRDPLGHANEIFKPRVAGTDLKLAILLLVNKIKEKQEIPDVFRLCNITSIFKKGKRSFFSTIFN